MNVREGIRRLGIFLGASGGLLGGFLAYPDAQTVLRTRTAHRKFESVMTTPTMVKVKEHPYAEYRGAIAVDDPDAKHKRGAPMDPDQFMAQWRAGKVKGLPPPPPGYTLDPPRRPDDWETVSEGDGKGGLYLHKAHPLLKGNRDGIAKVYFDARKRVAAIELDTGESVERTEAPAPGTTAGSSLQPVPLFDWL